MLVIVAAEPPRINPPPGTAPDALDLAPPAPPPHEAAHHACPSVAVGCHQSFLPRKRVVAESIQSSRQRFGTLYRAGCIQGLDDFHG